MRRTLKFIHTMAAIGMMGALAAHIVLLATAPPLTSFAEYAAVRQGIAAIAEWILFPSLGLVLVSGLLSMTTLGIFHDAPWAWVKLLTAVLVFEHTLLSVQGPAVRFAELSAAAVGEPLDPKLAARLMDNEWGALWVILALATANVVLGVWRPRFRRRRRQAAAATE